MPHWAYEKGLFETGNGIYAYLQPDGGWGWSNAGLIRDGDESLLVDTLFDAPLTREMLKTMADATGLAAEDIGTVVNTHANGDHTHGNGLCVNAEVVASEASAREMEAFDGKAMQAFMDAAPNMGGAGEYLQEIFGIFNFRDIAEKLPTKTFSGELTLTVGDRDVQLIEVGPAHTAGDVLAWVPDAKTIYTGDILFIDGTPIMWAGPVSNWIAACDRIIELEPDVIVPGHGPITDAAGVRRVQEYLNYIESETRMRFDAGMSVRDAAFDIKLGDYESWGDNERIGINVNTLYREFGGEGLSQVGLFELMGDLARRG